MAKKKVTVADLISFLEDITDQDMEVFVEGHDGGFDPVRFTSVVRLVEKDSKEGWWEGSYREVSAREGLVGQDCLFLNKEEDL